tara:strand:- start:162 stop:599 length:438 start_codon:yes stop_codon:yes gene_type:complete
MKTISYKGKIEANTQEEIRLSTIQGKIGYKIRKLSIIGEEPGEETVELILKIYKIKQDTINNTVDFSDDTLLGVAYLIDSSSTATVTADNIIFDNEMFNQDIYVTAVDASGSNRATNYYLELEQFKLNDIETTMATLKDIRTIES